MIDRDTVIQDANFNSYILQRLDQVLDYVSKKNPQVIMVAWQSGNAVEVISIPSARVVVEGLAYEIIKMFEDKTVVYGKDDEGDEDDEDDEDN